MISHYFKTAIRILVRNKLYSLINLFGLIIGFTFSFLLLIYVLNEYSYDSLQVNRDRIFRITESLPDAGWTQPQAPNDLARFLKEEFPVVENTVSTRRFGNVFHLQGTQHIPINLTGSTNPLFEIFDFKILEGRKEDFLKEPNDLIINKTTAGLLFHKESVLGESITLNVNGNDEIFTVKGVFEDFPWNSSIQYKAIGHISWPIRNLNKVFAPDDAATAWNLDFFSVYFKLKQGASSKHLQEDLIRLDKMALPKKVHFGIQSLKDFYLGSSNLVNNGAKEGDQKMVNIMLVISFLILLIASINYILLSSARSMSRYKEIAVRMVIGAKPQSIRRQFLGESILLSFIGFIISLIFTISLVPVVNSSFHRDLHFSLHENYLYILFFLLLSILVGIISGSYVAFYYSRLKPALAFSRMGGIAAGKFSLWKVLLILQIVLFVGLVMVTTAIREQINYLKTSDLGFNSKNLILVNLDDNEKKQYHALLNELSKNPAILSASGGFFLPPTDDRSVYWAKSPSDPNNTVKVEGMSFDVGCMEMLGMKMVSGRTFTKEMAGDSVKVKILNETAAKALGIKYTADSIWAPPDYIGVVKDFFLHSKHENIAPTIIDICNDKYLEEIAIRCYPEAQSRVMTSLEKLWKSFFGDTKPNSVLFENAIGDLYSSEEELARLLMVFTWLIILISILGLFAFSLFVIEKRTKEIGIKKVNGATAMDIFKSISWEFLRLVLLAILISWPAGWYIIHKWQQNFAYHEGPGLKIFVFSGVMALVVVQLTILIHILKASRSNPMNALRYE